MKNEFYKLKNEFYKLVEAQIGEITRYKKEKVQLPSQIDEIETFIDDPARFFITFTSDLRPKLRDLAKNQPQTQEKADFNEVRGRRKRKKPGYEAEKGLPWWEKGVPPGGNPGLKVGQKSPAIPKFGINPGSGYNTPNGIYSYPLNSRIFSQFRRGNLPYAQDKPYFSVFKVKEGANIVTIDENGTSSLVPDEERYNEIIQKLFSEGFFSKLSSKKLPGQQDDDDAKDWWKNYAFVIDRTHAKDYTGIKDGFSGHYVRKYLMPHLQDLSTPLRDKRDENSKLYLAIKNYPFVGGQNPQDYALLSDLEIVVQDVAALIHDWNLQYRGGPNWKQRKGAAQWLFGEMMKDPGEWGMHKGHAHRTPDLEEWMENIKEIVEEDDRARMRSYHTLVKVDVMMIRDVFDTFYNWKGEDPEGWIFDEKEDEELMDRLFMQIIIQTDRIDDEIDGKRKSGGIRKYINFDAGEPGNPREEPFFRSMEESALIDTWFGKLWAVTRELSDQNAFKWSRIWRTLGIDGINDLGGGVIHSSEPTQAVFFAIDSVEHVKSFENKSKPDDLQHRGEQKRAVGKFRESSFALARKLFKKRLPKEYHQNLHNLANSPLRSGNMGLKRAQAMINRNQNHFPVSDQHLKMRLEDENFMRGKPTPEDRDIGGTSIANINAQELERVYELGHLPLFSVEWIEMYEINEKLDDWAQEIKKDLEPLYDKANTAMNKLWKEILKKEGDVPKDLRDVVSQMSETQEWYRLIDPLTRAKKDGHDVSELLELVPSLMWKIGYFNSHPKIRNEIRLKMVDVSLLEDAEGPFKAYELLKRIHKVLKQVAEELMSGKASNETLLKIDKRAFEMDYTKDIESKETIQMKPAPEPKSAPWDNVTFMEEVNKYLTELANRSKSLPEEIDQYLISKEILEEDENFDDISTEDLLNPEKRAPWEKEEQTT